jgi:hypothetical protein
MCCTHPELARALMELRVEEARRAADAPRLMAPTGRHLERQAALLLTQLGTWLISLGDQLARTTRAQPLT